PLPVEDTDHAAAVVDDALGLETRGRLADARPRRGQHCREALVRKAEVGAPDPVVQQQQPARHALHDGMERVAGERAAREVQPERAKAEERAAESLVLPAKVEQRLWREAVRLAR